MIYTGRKIKNRFHTRGIRKIKQVARRRKANKIARRSRKRNRT